MLIKDIKKNIAKYNCKKGYGRLYVWGDRDEVIFLIKFMQDKSNNDNVSFMEFHEYLQNKKLEYRCLFYKKDHHSKPRNTTFSDTNASMLLIFQPWFDELSEPEKKKVADDNKKSHQKNKKKNCSGSYGAPGPTFHIPR